MHSCLFGAPSRRAVRPHRKRHTYINSPNIELMIRDVSVAIGSARHQIGKING